MDLMFDNREFCYLVAINVNTRKLWFAQTSFNKNTVQNADEMNEADFEKAAKSMKSASSVKIALGKILKDNKQERRKRSH